MPLRSPDTYSRAKALFAFLLLLPVILSLAPMNASAQTAGLSPEESAVVNLGVPTPFQVNVAANTYEETNKKIHLVFNTYAAAGIRALMNSVQFVFQSIAAEGAKWILTGGTGEGTAFHEKDFAHFLANVAETAGNGFISDINTGILEPLNLGLCTPIDPLKLTLPLTLPGQQIPNLSQKCTLDGIKNAWEQTKDSFQNIKDVNEVISAQFKGGSQFDVGLSVQERFLDIQQDARQGETLQRQENRGFKGVTDLISGDIATPAEVVLNTVQSANILDTQTKKIQQDASALIDNAFELGFTQVGILTAATFLDTLISGGIQKVFKGLNSLTDHADLAGNSVDLLNSQAITTRNLASARVVLSDLLTPNLFTDDQQDFVIELSSCPSPRGLWNCAMDDAFAAALRSQGEQGAYTVGQASHVVTIGNVATNPEFLHKDWELIPQAETKDDTDSTCYQRAYCASNLAKLRYARIIPVGWEMAANSPYNHKKNGRYVTLQEVIRGFNVCNSAGQADQEHPWCKMIDPNWVLTAPPFQCRVKGYGDTVFSGTGIRVQECADAASCLKRDDHGKCIGGYGYCVAEKPVWRFSADECSERFASCRTYVSSAGVQVSYLRNTLDYGSCTADNVGCLWYASIRNGKDRTGTAWDNESKVYFDKTLKTCSSANDGCTKVFEVKAGHSALNLVQNGSFEDGSTEENVDGLSAWDLSSGGGKVTSEAFVEGNRSIELTQSGTISPPTVAISSFHTYTLSMYARAAATSSPVTPAFALAVHLKTAAGANVAQANIYRSSSCSVAGSDLVGFDEAILVDSMEWKPFVCTFVANPDSAYATIELNGENVFVDTIQLEAGETPTSFVNGLAGGLTERHLKLPPQELGCTGSDTDNPLCLNYARMCAQADAGCQGYRDTSNPSAPEIPATLSATDFCPSSCVGYAEYRKQPSAFDLGRNADARLDDPEDEVSAVFIPTTGAQCTIQDVGCEEFTNVQAASQGGEQKSYFNYVRACEKPSQETETFFTWEGSDTTGYQLRTWSLIHDSTKTPAPPKLIQKVGPEGILKDSASCNDALWASGADPDCRQLYNANGDVFYAFMSQTIVSTDQCTDFRKNKSDAADCEKTGGAFTPTTGECIYHVLPSESRMCSNAAAGCRAYLGSAGRNTSEILFEDFRTATGTPFTFGELSKESILVGDQSLKLTGQTPLGTATVFPSFPNVLYRVSFWVKTTSPSQQAATLSVDGKTVGTFPMDVDWRRYEFGPFAGSFTASSTSIGWSNFPNATFLDQIRIERVNDVSFVVKDSWVTPAECDQTPEGLPQPQAMLGCRAYTDRDKNIATVRQFGHLCSDNAIGCKAFVDTRNSSDSYVQTFTTSGTDSNTKVTPEAQTWEAQYVGSWSLTRPADRFVYAIDEPRARCPADQDSCRAFGKPKLDQDALQPQIKVLTGDDAKAIAGGNATSVNIGDYESVYFIDDINQYRTTDGEPNAFCRKDELFCDEFKSGKTVAYFRNPFSHACEWRDKVLLHADPANNIPTDGEYSGWFRTGLDLPCYPKLLSSGNSYLTQNAGDPTYTGWASLCPVEQSECTEFRDPNDHSDPIHPSGKPYFFIKNQRLDLSSCNGRVDFLSGCVLFRDLSDPRQRYSVDATYAKTHAEGDTPQTPIDCINDPDNSYCKTQKSCKNVHIASCDGFGCKDPKLVQGSGFCVDDTTGCQNPANAGTTYCQQLQKFASCTGVDTAEKVTRSSCQTDADCTVEASDQDTQSSYKVIGTCGIDNDANVVMKVKLDRDCAEWLGCSTAERVYDPVQQKYTDLCTEIAMCNQTKGANENAFCGNYIDRRTEPVLNVGTFFDRATYTSRKTGFGQLDYSGYAIPDQFQAADIQNRLVAKELFYNTPTIANKFATDYRLVAAIPASSGLIEFPANANSPLDPLHPDLLICRNKQTGRTGYFYPKFFPAPGVSDHRICYFAIDALSQRQVDIQANQNGQNIDPRDIQVLADEFRQTKDPKNDVALQHSFPPAECKSYPESNAPFPNLYVDKWDFATEPFQMRQVKDGYQGSSLCEYGEDCSCSYRRVKYAGGQAQKYYSPFGGSPIGGVCSGGAKDGQGCVPGQKTVVSGPNAAAQAQSTTEDVGCPGGRCLAISDVVLVRGQFGQCLQRDYSRTVANDPGRHPCLIWNPNPILSGTYDVTHYNPMAGYVPPVNAGEYYCLSNASPSFESVWTAQSRTVGTISDPSGSRKPGDAASNPGDGANPFFSLPGKLAKFNYDEGYIAGQCHNADECNDPLLEGVGVGGKCNCHDGSGEGGDVKAPDLDFDEIIHNDPSWFENTCGPAQDIEFGMWMCTDSFRFVNLGQTIDGTKPWTGGNGESPQALRCMLANTDPDPEVKEGILPWERAPFMDYNRGRWIMTGRGLGRTYMEYFFPVKAAGVAQWLSPNAPVTDESKKQATLERNFAQFQFFPVNDQFAAACSIPPEFTDGVTVQDWSDVNQVAQASNQVFSQFNKDFDGQLDRSKENVLIDKEGKPVKLNCSGINDPSVDTADLGYGTDGQCYYKYWETDYRMDGVSKFEWLDAEAGTSFWDRHGKTYSHERTCSKSGFALRAMFEDTSASENNTPVDQAQPTQLSGPWRFVGFWVTACKVGDDFESSLFLSLRVKHADICREIGQVISPYSRESAAFADRVWAGGNFVIPNLGFSFSTQYAPFGSALATGVPSREPLFQTNGPVENWSALKPPTFLGSGPSYTDSHEDPQYRWAHLTNIFARVYRVYEYLDTAVTKEDSVCTNLSTHDRCPNKPSAQPGTPEYTAWSAKVKEACGAQGDCDATVTSQAVKDSVHLCNGLSGVNAGLDCGAGFAMPSLDPLCHNAAMKRNGQGGLEPQLGSCVKRNGWTQDCADHPEMWRNPQDHVCYSATVAHEQFNAFQCGQDSLAFGLGCTVPETKSWDCPMFVTNIPCVDDALGPMNGHCGGGYEGARCNSTNDCTFTGTQWWGARDNGTPKDQDLGDPWAPGEDTSGKPGLWSFIYPYNGAPRVAKWLPTAYTQLGYGNDQASEHADLPLVGGNNQAFLLRAKPLSFQHGITVSSNPTPYDFTQNTQFGAMVRLDMGSALGQRYPQAHPAEISHQNDSVGERYAQPGLCEGAYGADMDPQNSLAKDPANMQKFNSYFNPNMALQAGACVGGPHEGQLCLSSTKGYSASGDPGASGLWTNVPSCWGGIQPVSDSVCQPVKVGTAPDGGQIPLPGCEGLGGDPKSNDPDLDNNLCTHRAGYKPRTDLCSDPNSEKCLVGYDLAGNKQASLDYSALAPTDVTPGFHKQSFLGLGGADPDKERYIAFYAPRPPTIAAPDLSHTCEVPGQCRISSVNAFTLEDQSSGPLFFGGGKAQVAMRFYGWAANEQTPLKALTIDWGDGTITKIDNARLKNKKPFCGGTQECELVPGLTCQTDSDCPPAGGKCSAVGTCGKDSSKTCFRNADCQSASNPTDVCNVRTLFGNSPDACEANYFEFSHAYSCDANKMNPCREGQVDSKRCSRNPDVKCTTAADCGSGDTCEAELAQSSIDGVTGGCFDDVKVACRYTPKVMLEDSWNWCTGECRSGTLVGGQPQDVSNSSVKHVYGGCWDGTETGKNTNKIQKIMSSIDNECSQVTNVNKNVRPWIVYPGSVQIGVFQ